MKQNLHHKKLSELVVPGKYVAKEPKKRLEVQKNELDKRAMKLNYMKLDEGVIMQKIFKRTYKSLGCLF